MLKKKVFLSHYLSKQKYFLSTHLPIHDFIIYLLANKWTADANLLRGGRDSGLPDLDTMFNPMHTKK